MIISKQFFIEKPEKIQLPAFQGLLCKVSNELEISLPVQVLFTIIIIIRVAFKLQDSCMHYGYYIIMDIIVTYNFFMKYM